MVKNANGKNSKNDELTEVKCDATRLNDVEELIHGSDVVVSLIGHSFKSSAGLQTETIKNVVKVMKKHKIKRLVSLTGTGVRFPKDKITLADRILNGLLALILPKVIKDGVNHAKVLKNSELDWTIVRALKLTTGSVSDYKLTLAGPAKFFVPRATIAKAILEVIENNSFVKRSPLVSNVTKTNTS